MAIKIKKRVKIKESFVLYESITKLGIIRFGSIDYSKLKQGLEVEKYILVKMNGMQEEAYEKASFKSFVELRRYLIENNFDLTGCEPHKHCVVVFTPYEVINVKFFTIKGIIYAEDEFKFKEYEMKKDN